jgi:xanthine dehydrogenase accessory factor
MNERALVWLEAARLALEGHTAGMATVSRRRGSLPMARDAKLVACDDGRHWGTVGGGCTEANVIGQALEAAAAGRPAVVRHTLNADLAGDVGLSCGGTAEFFLEPIVSGATAAALYEAVGRAILARTPAEVRTAVDWTAGPSKRARVGEETLVLGTMPARVEQYDGDREAEEEFGLFIEAVPRLPRVIVFGAGHVGVEIARLAARAGFYVVAVDDRDEFADARRLPGVDEVIVEGFRTALDRLLLDADDYVLATTRGHSFDAYIVERTAASDARYVGMLGSRRKKEVIWKALRAAGVPESALARVRVPIGESIGADTPAEIAVSVVAELIRIRRSGDLPGK